MKKKLVIVESPAKAKTINKYLGPTYQVEASMGHIRDLPKTQLGVDLDHDFKPTYSIIDRAKKTVAKLKKAAKGKDSVYLAPDPDREGEAISWHLKHIFEEMPDIKIYRVTFNEITKSSIQKAFEHPREIDMDLVDSQQARRVLDRIVGYKISPLLWKNVAKGLSAGRVQSVAVRLIIEREEEIEKFKPVEYWNIKAKLSSEKPENKGKVLTAKLDKVDGKKVEINDKKFADELVKEVKEGPFEVKKIDEREKKRNPQAPYTTSKLQQESFTRLRFSAQKTMSVAQRLYEGVELGDEGTVGLITYMRTDSTNVSKDSQVEAKKFISEKYGKEFLPEKTPIYSGKKKKAKVQEAHEAIRPSMPSRDPEQLKKYLDKDEFRLYDLIWRRFVSSQMVAARDNVTSIDITVNKKYQFRAAGTRNIFKGFLLCLEGGLEEPKATAKDKEGEEKDDPKKENLDLPKLEVGEILKLLELLHTQHFTKPPARYNDASIVRTLEELGIGRPSTYAPTIQTVIARNYVERKSSALHPTEMGKIVTKLLVEHFGTVLNYEFTASMEEELDKIEEGEMKWADVLNDFYTPFKKRLDLASTEMKSVKKVAEETDQKCEKCGSMMVIKWGRFGKFMACSGFPNCKNTAPISLGIKCQKEGCEGDLVKRSSKRGRPFYGCSTYPKCDFITNKLPKKEGDEEEITES